MRSSREISVGDVVLRRPYDGREAEVSAETALVCPEPTLAQQQFRDDSNPNVIMELYTRTGDASILAASNPRYGDFIGAATDYHTALNIILAADDAFLSLPAATRARFENDAGAFADFISDPKNRDEALKLGLLKEGLSIPSTETAQALDEGEGVGNPVPPPKSRSKGVSARSTPTPGEGEGES